MGSKTVSAILALVCALCAHAEIVDEIVATVDTEAILHSEIMTEIAPNLRDLRASAGNENDFNSAADELFRATLDQAIENKILLREAMLAGLEPEEEMVDKRLEEIRGMYGSNDEFQAELDRAGETLGDLRVRIRKQLMARSMGVRKQRELEKQCVVSESEIAQYYEDHKSEFERAARVRVRQIFLPASADKNERAVAKARMEELKAELAKGADFGELAKAHSQGPGAEAGGMIGWVVKGDLVPVLEEGAFALAEGAHGDIIESDNGLHILFVDQKEDAGLATLDEVRTEIEPVLRANMALDLYKKWMKELRKKSRVRVYY